jgi:predicted signal transduction protein with EAL and GGDEF domain
MGSRASLHRSPAMAKLTLEVTESVLVHDEQRALIVFDNLKNVGVRLALDDFGTGYSSLGYLNTLPIDTLKIDHTFVATLTHDPDSQRIVAAIIALAHSLKMTVVAEGVETASQHCELTKLASDYCQGFYFGRPMHAEELNRLIAQQRHPGTPPTTNRPTLEFAAQMCQASELRSRERDATEQAPPPPKPITTAKARRLGQDRYPGVRPTTLQ